MTIGKSYNEENRKHAIDAIRHNALLTKLPWIYRMGFITERRHPEECSRERVEMQKGLLDWVEHML